jgi:ABC-type tungstate transport system permease subunit
MDQKVLPDMRDEMENPERGVWRWKGQEEEHEEWILRSRSGAGVSLNFAVQNCVFCSTLKPLLP